MAVLDLAAKEAGWGKPLPPGRGRGVALLYSGWGTYLAQVAEVEVPSSGEVRVHRIVCAVDCGTMVNPDIVKAQIESGVVFGISGALWGEITLKNGRVEQSNFQRLPGAADERDPADRGAPGAKRRGARRDRRARHGGDGARARQRDLRGHGKAAAKAAPSAGLAAR